MNISLQISDLGKLQAMMNVLGPSNRLRLNKVGASELERHVRDHIRRYVPARHRTANELGGKATGHYRKGLAGVAGHATAQGGEVVIPIAGISRAFHDIDLSTPTRYGKSFYAIPKHAKSYGHTVGEMKSRGWKIFRPGQKRILLGYKSKGEKPVILFALAKHVHQRQDPSLLPAPDSCARVVSDAMTRSINERLRNAR